MRTAALALALLGPLALSALAQETSLATVEAISDPERRSKEAVRYAQRTLDRAVRAYRGGDAETGRAELGRVADAVDLAVASLESTGRHPRKHPRPFKNAEIQTRNLIRQMQQAQRQAHFEDFEDYDAPIERVSKANRKLLLGIMSSKK